MLQNYQVLGCLPENQDYLGTCATTHPDQEIIHNTLSIAIATSLFLIFSKC